MENFGKIVAINGNIITAEFDCDVKQNEVAFALLEDRELKSEVIRIKGKRAELQVFEDTGGLMPGDKVKLTGELLSVELGPGLLGQLYDGLQNPLHKLAEAGDVFLERGKYAPPLSKEQIWNFTPTAEIGTKLQAGDQIGWVAESLFEHKIMIPFYLQGRFKLVKLASAGAYSISEELALVEDEQGHQIPIKMSFNWPVKRAVRAYHERLPPTEPLITRIRIIDTLFPVAKGGTYCIPGPFGAGKTVLQQITSRHAKVDVVIIAACGERANEVVETIKEFPELTDPYTGKSLMERTIIICNTSSMPVAARESSVYTAVSIAEYYRQMGLDVLLLADSTSRWAQALRERSGRLEEIPGEEAFPAYLESLIANFYERAGRVKMRDGSIGSVTIGGAVSPAGGNFEEPVTQATLKVVGAFHGLSRQRSDARRYPAIDPLDSWTRYVGIISEEDRHHISKLLSRANEINQMMKVVGEEGTSLGDYILYQKGEFFDSVYLQQNAFDEVDAATSEERQTKVFNQILKIIKTQLALENKEKTRAFFNNLRQIFLDYNYAKWESEQFKELEKDFTKLVESHDEHKLRSGFNHMDLALVESDLDSDFTRPDQDLDYQDDLA